MRCRILRSLRLVVDAMPARPSSAFRIPSPQLAANPGTVASDGSLAIDLAHPTRPCKCRERGGDGVDDVETGAEVKPGVSCGFGSWPIGN
jgi:hypothetical protein